MKPRLEQIGGCCSWKTSDSKYQIDYWANANRPRRANGADGGYGMYTLTRLSGFVTIGSFTSKRAAIAAIAKAEGN